MSAASSKPVTFTAPMPGLEGSAGFTLSSVAGAPGLHALEASTGLPVRLFLAEASMYMPDYGPDLPSSALEAGQSTTLLVVTPGPGAPTVNLAAPIVLNPDSGLCTQLVLNGENYPLRASLTPRTRTQSAE